MLLGTVVSYVLTKDMLILLLITQIFAILLPVFLTLQILKLPAKGILRLKVPRIKEVILVLLIAIPSTILLTLAAQLSNTILPFPEEYIQQMENIFELDNLIWRSFLIIAIVPAICEELLFRGLMPHFFKKYGFKANVVFTALLFAAFHLDPYRFFTVFLLGLLLGYITLRSGTIYNSMISHAINNSLGLVMSAIAGSSWLNTITTDQDDLRYWLAVPAIIILAVALYLFHKITGGKVCAESLDTSDTDKLYQS